MLTSRTIPASSRKLLSGAIAIALVAVAMVTLCAAEAPYIGKWKLNPSKSQLTGETETITKLPSGDYQFDDEEGYAYTFRLDGKPYPTPDGSTRAWKVVSPDVWERTAQVKGKTIRITRLTLNGDRLTWLVTTPQTGGKDMTQSSVAKRISGGPGISGKWQIDKANPAAN